MLFFDQFGHAAFENGGGGAGGGFGGFDFNGADILVFDSGKILERGSHEELLQQRKLYFELWNAQAKYYQKENGNDDTKKDSCIL